MGSLVDTSTVNLLEYLRSKTQIDVDSLDIRGELAYKDLRRLLILILVVSTALGPFVDCTSNQVMPTHNTRSGLLNPLKVNCQAESYTELLNPQRASLLEKSVALARQMLSGYPNVTFEELAFEISVRFLYLLLKYNNCRLKYLADGRFGFVHCPYNHRSYPGDDEPSILQQHL